MNTDGKMSFKDFVFPINPSFIKISHSRKLSKQKVPYGNNVVFDMGGNERTVSGEGEFYGDDCIETFEKLKKVFESGGGGILYIPSQRPVYAVFSSLEMLAEDIENTVKYRFTFTESFARNTYKQDYGYIADGKNSLWDISYKYGVCIETLLELNPFVCRPDSIIENGKRVTLC